MTDTYRPRIKWNLTRMNRPFRDADALVISVAKSGRTWFRVMLSKYLSLHFGCSLKVGGYEHQVTGMPHILYSHELWSHASENSFRRRLLGHHLCDRRHTDAKPVIVVHRDPRDVLVSLYFHLCKRERKPFKGDLSDLIRSDRSGIWTMVKVMNNWRERFGTGENRLWIGYSELHATPEQKLSQAIRLIGLVPDEALVKEAVEFSEFDNMKKLEREGQFGVRFLTAKDPSDPDSYKVRSGKIGGYREHFSSLDLGYVNDALRHLDPWFGYSCSDR